MAFQSLSDYNENLTRGLFTLGDGESSDVIFLLRKPSDVMLDQVHYLIGPSGSSYVECNGRGCAICNSGKNIPVQTRCFLPVYRIEQNDIVFWDRSRYWVNRNIPQLFERYSNLSEFVFNISRIGMGRDDTKYSISVKARNSVASFDDICKKFNISFPTGYYQIVKQMTNEEMKSELNDTGASNSENNSTSPSNLKDYNAQPRASYDFNNTSFADIPDYAPENSKFDIQNIPVEDNTTNVSEVIPEDDNDSDIQF